MRLVLQANLLLLITLQLLLLCHQVACSRLASEGARQRRDVSKELNAHISTPASLNLKSILQHQDALAHECAQYQRQKVRQLEQLREFSRQNEQVIHLAQPLTLELPAVCLFVFGQQIGLAEPADQWTGKLELVNWIFDEELLPGNQSNNMTKREASPVEAEDPLSYNDLLSEYLIDTSANSSSRYMAPSEINPERAEQERRVEEVMADGRFQEAIASNRHLLTDRLSPVVLVPGLLGSRLQARTDKTRRVNIFCSKQSDWQDMWLSLRQLLPLAVDCWLDNVHLDLNLKTGYTRAPPGVQTRVPDFGSVESVRHLDLRQPKMTQYFSAIISHYEKLGYEPDKNLFAAPYDFRLAPQELSGFFLQLRQLIEGAHAPPSGASKRKVTLLCHSMGCTHLLVFLRLQSAAWRETRIRKLIALSSPWGGAIKAVKALTVGDQLELPLVSEVKMRRLVRNYPSVAFLSPLAEVFAAPSARRSDPGGPVLVQTPARQYRAADLPDLLLDLNLSHQLRWFKESSALIKPMEPLVDLHVDCIHSLNTPTPETLIFRNQSDFPNGDYELVTGEGDGTVNFESLMVCSHWAAKLPSKVSHKVIMNTNHVGILTHKAVLSHLTNDVLIG